MYHPTNRPDGRNLEFIEIYNSNPWTEDLSGYRISGDVGYTFPAGTTIAGLSYRVVAAKPADVQAVYGLSGVLGPLTNSTPGNATNVLDNGGGTVRLRDEINAVLAGSHLWRQPRPGRWRRTAPAIRWCLPALLRRRRYSRLGRQRPHGRLPGRLRQRHAAGHPCQVLINEFLAHTDPPLEDSIELFNYSSTAVDLGGCVLTDDPATNRFRITSGHHHSGARVS